MRKNTRRRETPSLRVIPIGGLTEIGKNLTVLEFQNQILIIDCGMSFPEDEMYGIDVVLPDFSYLKNPQKKIKGIILTHGHEDHIGAIPYLLKEINVPVYGTRLTLGLVKSKLDEHGLTARLNTIKPGDRFRLGMFSVETIRTTHSIADAVCYFIETPAGSVLHTGDFKIDYTPVDGEPINFTKLAEIGSKGVTLLMSDSTNAMRPGFTASERFVGEKLTEIFAQAKSRIIVATFSSNVHRLQKIIDISAKYNRKVVISGRSMENVVRIASELHYLKAPKGTIITINEANRLPDKKVTIITTGSQGEPMSALARMAKNEHKSIQIKKGDKVILSSTPVPGNEKTVTTVINTLIEKGADVIYSDIAETHVSGHARQEELKIMLSLIKPKFFMPVHGEIRHLLAHKQIAVNLGMKEDRIFIMENGCILDMNRNRARKLSEKIKVEDVLVDGLGVGDVGSIVLKDRKLLSEAGLIIAAAAIDRKACRVVSGPDIISRGFVYVRENEDLIDEARIVVENTLEKCMKRNMRDWNAIKQAVRDDLRGFIYRKTERSPVILPIFLEV